MCYSCISEEYVAPPVTTKGAISFMANKRSVYRDPYIKQTVQGWFDKSTAHMTYPKRDRELPYLFREYTRFICDDPFSDLGCIMSYEDFARCLYGLGIVNISLLTSLPTFKQLDSWRPSIDQIKRLVIDREPYQYEQG